MVSRTRPMGPAEAKVRTFWGVRDSAVRCTAIKVERTLWTTEGKLPVKLEHAVILVTILDVSWRLQEGSREPHFGSSGPTTEGQTICPFTNTKILARGLEAVTQFNKYCSIQELGYP